MQDHDLRERVARMEGAVGVLTHCCCPPKPHGGRVLFKIGLMADTADDQLRPPGVSVRAFSRIPDVETNMLTRQFYTLEATFLDSKDKPAKVDGTPTWSTDNSDVVTLEPSADGTSCKVSSGDMPGTANIQVSADSDLGPDVKLIIGTDAVSVHNRPAVTVKLKGSEPVDIPDAPPVTGAKAKKEDDDAEKPKARSHH